VFFVKKGFSEKFRACSVILKDLRSDVLKLSALSKFVLKISKVFILLLSAKGDSGDVPLYLKILFSVW